MLLSTFRVISWYNFTHASDFLVSLPDVLPLRTCLTLTPRSRIVNKLIIIASANAAGVTAPFGSANPADSATMSS
jgi:hypothetical protein